MKNLLICAIVVAGLRFPLLGQWLNYPSASVPRMSNGEPDLSAACPRTPDGKPDFSGLWQMERNRPQSATTAPGCEPVSQEFINIGWSIAEGLPYQPWAAELVKTRRAEQRTNDPLSRCLPVGIIRQHTSPLYKKIAQLPGLLIILNEQNASYRQIFTDGRPLPKDPNPSWNGYSTAKWEGDTLVVRSNGFRDGLWLDTTGNPLTEYATITERFRRPTFGNLEIEVTVDDPKAYTKPWTIMFKQRIKLDTELLDYICSENEKDIKHFVK